MTTVNCPKCDERVRMPANASAQARVQCPLCVEEFELAEALDRLAPMLVVLNDPGAADAALSPTEKTFSGTDLVTDFDGESETASHEFSVEDPVNEAASVPAFTFEDGSATSGASGSAARRHARSQRPRKSALKEMVKIVGGGVIGLTIGQLILWWLPGDWNRDPIELGPKIPSFAAFLVHPDFRGDAVTKKNGEKASQRNTAGPAVAIFIDDTDNSESPTTPLDGKVDLDKGGREKKNKNKKHGEDPTSVANEVSAGHATETDQGKKPSNADGSSDPLSPLVTETENDLLGTKPDIEIPLVNLKSFPTATDTTPQDSPPSDSGDSIPPIPSPAADPTTTPPALTPPPAATGDFNGVRNAPKISVDQLSSRLSEAVRASIAMDTSSTEPIPKLAKEFYLTLAGLGEAITFVDQVSSSNEVDEVGKFALGVGKKAAKLRLIDKVAPSWMKSSRPHNGLVVCGTVDSINFVAPYYVTSLLMTDKSVLEVVSINDPSGDYQRQDKILVLGSILDSPQQNLKNYQGEATTVILDGLHATLPNAE